MAQRNPSESQQHSDLIKIMAAHFQKQGFTDIRADLPGYTQPDIIRGTQQDHQPDLTCRRNDAGRTMIILEAETASTVFDAHTASQWTLFAHAAGRWGGEFHVVVPKEVGGRSGHEAAKGARAATRHRTTPNLDAPMSRRRGKAAPLGARPGSPSSAFHPAGQARNERK